MRNDDDDDTVMFQLLKTNPYRILVVKPENKLSFGRLKSRWVDSDIKVDRITYCILLW